MPDRRLANFCTQSKFPHEMVKYTHKKAKGFIGAALSVIVLTACNPNATSTTLVTKHSSNDKIFHKIDPDQPRVEQQLTVSIQAPEHLTFSVGKIEGLNMNMGYMPVIFERKSTHEWRATVYLGACAEPRMHWQVIVPWQSSLTDEEGLYQFEFYTDTN